GRDDFQIALCAQRQQSILCTPPWMHTAKYSSDAGVLFDERDSFLQIATAEQDVVERGRHLIDERHVSILRSLRDAGSWTKNGGNLQKASARQGHELRNSLPGTGERKKIMRRRHVICGAF